MFTSNQSGRTRFRNRREAGRELATHLTKYANQPDVLVFGLPRGGVPVAFEVAKALHAPLDVFVVRKLGVPGNEELAMGAIASGGVRVVNQSVVETLGISGPVIAAAAERELRELERQELALREQRRTLKVGGRTVILVDDGIATGSTMRAAVKALRLLSVRRVIVATPTAALESAQQIRSQVDGFVAVMTPLDFSGVGQWYDDFSQTSDDEVRALLVEAIQFAGPTQTNPPFPGFASKAPFRGVTTNSPFIGSTTKSPFPGSSTNPPLP